MDGSLYHVYLYGFNVALTSKVILQRCPLVAVVFDQCAAKQECHAADTGHDIIIVYRRRANLSLCYPLMWNVILEYTSIHFNILSQTRPRNRSPIIHPHQRTLNFMMLLRWWSVRNSVESHCIIKQGYTQVSMDGKTG